ncbi:MAG: glycosyltransferase family 32 protein [Akkermansia sp.]
MIPKVIHYCWFGRGKMPKLARECLRSWRRYLPEYELREWNEDNFNLERYPYAKEAYESRKFAFVTDVVRLYVLYHEGGVYMDTDVEILKPLDAFLHHNAVSGFESENRYPTGLMAAEKGSLWAKHNLDWYEGKHFIRANGEPDLTPNVDIIMEVTERHAAMRRDNTFQDIPGYVTIYPRDYFSPSNWQTKEISLTERTVCIHHFAGSWKPKTPLHIRLKRRMKTHFPRLSAFLSFVLLRHSDR